MAGFRYISPAWGDSPVGRIVDGMFAHISWPIDCDTKLLGMTSFISFAGKYGLICDF